MGIMYMILKQWEVNRLDIFEIRLKVYLTNNIIGKDALSEISNLIDTCLVKSEKYSKYHDENIYKLYTFNSFYPLEKDRIYKVGNIYTIIIRTIDINLYKYFGKMIKDEKTNNIKALDTFSYKLKEKHIERIYSITPIILKTDSGYWKTSLTLKEYEDRLKTNLIKKYNLFTGSKIDENFQMFTLINFDNKVPIACDYKDIKLLGDKLDLVIGNNEVAQDLAKVAIGSGIGEMNARGYGFINYRYL